MLLNPTVIENTIYKDHSQAFTYDNLDRLTQADEGGLVSGSIALSNLTRKYDMDLLGNLTSAAGGFKQNSTSATFTHAVNATNEITTLTRNNPAGQARVVYDPFDGDSLSDLYSGYGTWSVSSGKAQVDALAAEEEGLCGAALFAPGLSDDGTYEVKITLAGSGDRAGVSFSATEASSGNGAQIQQGSQNNIKLMSFSTTPLGCALTTHATTSATIDADTEYTLRVRRLQRHVEFEVISSNLKFPPPVAGSYFVRNRRFGDAGGHLGGDSSFKT